MKKGISLIVLIITIIIILILTGAVILSFVDNNPIDRANEAVFKSDVSNLKSSVVLYVLNQIDETTTTTAGLMEEINLENVNSIVPEIETEYTGYFKVQKGKLVYNATVVTSETQKTWLSELGVQAATTTPAS